MQILLAQINTVVGDFEGNAERILAVVQQAVAQREAPVVVFPELAITGYPPEDLLLRPALAQRVEAVLSRLCEELPGAAWVVVGYPRRQKGALYNAAGVLHGGELVAEYFKRELPNYQVFDEKRYFASG